jgi:hypothetical protein
MHPRTFAPVVTREHMPAGWGAGSAMQIFMAYRRDDAGPFAGRPFDHLKATLRPHEVFRDIDSIPPGSD